jgi:hypothetical protein
MHVPAKPLVESKTILSHQYIHKRDPFIQVEADLSHRSDYQSFYSPIRSRRRRIKAQHVGFGEQPDDAPVEEGIHHNQRFGLGAVEGKDRLLHPLFPAAAKVAAYAVRAG